MCMFCCYTTACRIASWICIGEEMWTNIKPWTASIRKMREWQRKTYKTKKRRPSSNCVSVRVYDVKVLVSIPFATLPFPCIQKFIWKIQTFSIIVRALFRIQCDRYICIYIFEDPFFVRKKKIILFNLAFCFPEPILS